MSVSFYMDVNVHKGTTDGLRRRGVDVITGQEDGRNQRTDPHIVDRALALDRVVFTTDSDFLVEAARRQRSGEPFAGVVYAHQLRVSIGQCVNDLEIIAKAVDLADLRERVLYLPLS